MHPLRMMQNVSCEPLTLWQSEISERVRIFLRPHRHPIGSLHHAQGDNQNKPPLLMKR